MADKETVVVPPKVVVTERILTNAELFFHTLCTLQSQWFAIILTIGFNRDLMDNEFSSCLSNFKGKDDKPEGLFYEMFRCGNTSYFLWFLLSSEDDSFIPRLPTDYDGAFVQNFINRGYIAEMKHKRVIPGDLDLYFVHLGGALPDHTFIVAHIDGEWHLMQSFVGSYTFSSTHGFNRIVKIDHFVDMLHDFQYFSNKVYTPEEDKLTPNDVSIWESMQHRFMIYTHVNINKLKWVRKAEADEDFCKMVVRKHTVKAADLKERMASIGTKICKGLAQAHASKSSVITNPDQTYHMFIHNWLIDNSAFTMDDFKSMDSLRRKLTREHGFNGHDYNSSMIDINYSTDIHVDMEAQGSTSIKSVSFTFKVNVALSKLVTDGLGAAFGCVF